LLATLLALATPALAPTAHAQVGESCTVSVWTTFLRVTCSGLLYESVLLTWCPNHPAVDCLADHVLTCTVSTGRPIVCPLAA
ncbi:MAG TPA: hypothetical protein VNX21_06810, partial [Candidatus Thermoplasmatota archaeon]|nr:hypothetical protein [Candidatus Thermoplasmatota archaeon]